EPGGQRPVAVARLDGAAAEEDPSFMRRDGAHDEKRILVVDHAARVAQPSRQRVARRHAAHDGGAAVGAELHPSSRSVRPMRSGATSMRSRGAPERFTQKTRKPKALAPIASQPLDETKVMAVLSATPSVFIASS